MILPPEIHPEIVQYLWDDKKALKACSTASSTFTASAQRHLFSQIIIRGPLKPTKVQDIGGSPQNFKNLLDESPHIASYVDYLELFDDVRFTSRSGLEPTTREEWLSTDTFLASCLNRLFNLKALVIQYGNREDFDQTRWEEIRRWNEMPDALLSSILTLLHQPSLVYVDMKSAPINFILPGIGPNIRHVVVYDLLKDTRLYSAPSQPLPGLPELTSLFINYGVDMEDAMELFVNEPSRSFDITKLERLIIWVEGYDYITQHDLVAEFLESCSGTIKEFYFSPCLEGELSVALSPRT